ncbi:MAG: hypothetical protein ACOH15_04970 [Acetobacterium sp.]
MFMFTALAAFSAVEFFEGAVAAIALYVATKPVVRNPKRPIKK